MNTKITSKVLMVDDDQDVRELLTSILAPILKCAFDSARSVKEAAGLIEKNSYVAIVCDFMMPHQNGGELLKILIDKGISVPFIFFSTGPIPETLLQNPDVSHICKPHWEHLIPCLNEHLMEAGK